MRRLSWERRRYSQQDAGRGWRRCRILAGRSSKVGRARGVVAGGQQALPQPLSVVAMVTRDLRRRAPEESPRRLRAIALAAGDHEANRIAERIGQQADLAGEPTTRAADRLGVASAPAASAVSMHAHIARIDRARLSVVLLRQRREITRLHPAAAIGCTRCASSGSALADPATATRCAPSTASPRQTASPQTTAPPALA